MKTEITAENMDRVRSEMAANDQAAELVVGCLAWPIAYGGGQRGQMTVWPNGRAAVAKGGDSAWGEWDDATRTVTLDDDGAVVDEWGETVVEADGQTA